MQAVSIAFFVAYSTAKRDFVHLPRDCIKYSSRKHGGNKNSACILCDEKTFILRRLLESENAHSSELNLIKIL